MYLVFREGYEKIWKTIVEKENLDVKFNQNIDSIKRVDNRVSLEIWSGTFLKTVSCDFMIWAAPMKDFLRTAADATPQEWSLFESLTPQIFTANLVNVENAVKNFVYNAYLSNLESDAIAEEHGVLLSVNLKGLRTQGIESPEVLENPGEPYQDPIQTLSCLQLGKIETNELNLHQKLR